MADTQKRGVRKSHTGEVVSTTNAKTIIVRCERRTPHPLYGKVVRRAKRYHAHDEASAAKVGDKVKIVECRPYSKLKRWRLESVLSA